jgi:hypothetical protein
VTVAWRELPAVGTSSPYGPASKSIVDVVTTSDIIIRDLLPYLSNVHSTNSLDACYFTENVDCVIFAKYRMLGLADKSLARFTILAMAMM